MTQERRRRPPVRTAAGTASAAGAATSVARQLRAIERDGGDGVITFAGGATLHVSSLDKTFFPEAGITKGELMRYYTRVSPALLPAIDARPLALKRYPNGVAGPSFFQHAPTSPPAGVQVAPVPVDHGGEEPRLVGGELLTLLETVQLGTIAVNAWHSRLATLDSPDYCVLDLDPGPEAPFARVVRVAQWVRAALDRHALGAALKTSGSRGLHILVPLPAGSSYHTSAVLAERIAERIAAEHPQEATVARALGARAPGQVYVDHMQNARGKTLASVYAVRARPQATVSTPLSWRQLARPTFDPAAFTARTVPGQLSRLARRWEGAMRATNPPQVVEQALAELA